MTMYIQDWKYIPEYDKKYRISPQGEIFSTSRNLLITLRHNAIGRIYVEITFGGKVFPRFVDELVAQTYLPQSWFPYCRVVHLDGDIRNNNASNLNCEEAVIDLPGEVWSSVPELEGHVNVSNLGRVKRVDHIHNRPDHLFQFYVDADGYQLVSVTINGSLFSYRVHRLVARAFLDNSDNLPEVNHKDGNKQNNAVSNLEWCSRFYNLQHAVNVLGVYKNTSETMKSANRELRSTRIQCIETGMQFSSIKSAAAYYDVGWNTVADIVHNRTANSKKLPEIHFTVLKKGDKTK